MPAGTIFWASIIGFPLIFAVVASVLRLSKGAPQASSTEIAGLLMVLDFAALLDPDSFRRYVAMNGNGSDFTLVILLSAFFCIVIWIICLTSLEPKIVDYSRKHSVRFPLGLWLGMWSMTAVMIAANVAVFTGRIEI
jgi:hypothetical protein